MNICLTVFFENPFWVGIFEKNCGGIYEVSKVVFGSEPKDYEIYDFILKNFNHIKFSMPMQDDKLAKKKINPKRLQREIHKQTENAGIGTKAQGALKLDYENNKIEKNVSRRIKKQEDEKIKFKLRQEKKKQKKRGH